MTLSAPLTRSIMLAGLILTSTFAAVPAQAAKADLALLKSYVGDWRGRGVLTGQESESVSCRMTLSEGNDDKINYAGRCVMAGTNVSVNGTLAYVDEQQRFEAAMTTNATFTGIAVGRKQGNGVVFNLKEKEKDEKGNDVTITAQILLQNDKINVEFNMVFNESGDMLKASVPFTK